jgi:hypothetical protein
MMKSIKNWILIMVACLAVQAASAQYRSPLSINVDYVIAQPLGALQDYSNRTSFRGWRAGIQYMLNNQFSIGLRTGYQDYYERAPREIYTGKGTAISAVQTRTLQVVPIQATAHYQFTKPSSPVIPYAGLGIGVADMLYEKYYGEFVARHDAWQFLVSPEVGINIPFGKASPVLFNLSVQYNYSPYDYNEISGFNTIQGNIGVKVHLH